MTRTRTAALVGVVGGAGTTRLGIECAATLARTDREVVVVDADYATQGIARHVDGEIDTDVTLATTDDVAVEEALFDLDLDLPGSVSVCPARAPFERLARAKTAAAAEAFETLLDDLIERADHVLIDTPAIVENQAITAVTAADRVMLVAPDTPRGADAIQRTRERLADIGTAADATILNRSSGDPIVPADACVPLGPPEESPDPSDSVPACTFAPETQFAAAIADAAEAVVDAPLDIDLSGPSPIDRVETVVERVR